MTDKQYHPENLGDGEHYARRDVEQQLRRRLNAEPTSFQIYNGRGIRRALYDIGIYPTHELGEGHRFRDEVNREYLKLAVDRLDREDVEAIARLVESLLKSPRSEHFYTYYSDPDRYFETVLGFTVEGPPSDIAEFEASQANH